MEKAILTVKQGNTNVVHPITNEIVQRSFELLNKVFNSIEFEKELCAQTFVKTNRPGFGASIETISGKEVFDDFINKGEITIDVEVKRSLGGFLKRLAFRTMGETLPSGSTIVTYPWWLKKLRGKDLLVGYATHVGHEIFHTRYYGYIHDPEFGSRGFVNERDVTYKIDDILEALIAANA